MNKFSRPLRIAASAVALAALAACATAPEYYPAPVTTTQPYPPAYPPVAQAAYVEYGQVSAVEVIRTEEQNRSKSGAGALIGAIAGGVLGNQIGGGSGRAIATIGGAVGGAAIGNNVEGRNNRVDVTQTYRVSVRVDNGQIRAFDVPSPGDLRVGDRVRLQGGQISRV